MIILAEVQHNNTWIPLRIAYEITFSLCYVSGMLSSLAEHLGLDINNVRWRRIRTKIDRDTVLQQLQYSYQLFPDLSDSSSFEFEPECIGGWEMWEYAC